MANRIFDLQETRGSFQVKGIVNGVSKDRFYSDKKTKTGKDFRSVNFGCAYDHQKSVYLSLNGMPQKSVWFSKKNQATGKTETKEIPWANRNKFNEDGFRMIGVNLGLEKTFDVKTKKEVNLKKTMAPFDACGYMNENMQDDMSVFIRGNLEFSSFMDNDNNIRRSIKYIPNQVSLCQDVVYAEYNNDTNKPIHDFTQNIVFMGIEKEKDSDDKLTGRAIVSAKIVTYNDIVDTEFIILDSKLAGVFNKNLKAYNAITVHGKIEVSHAVQEVEEEDCWGEANSMNSVSNPTKIELIITGATPSTIDKETYTEKDINEAIKKIRASKEADNKFVANDDTSNDSDWGDSANDDEEPW